MDAGDLAVFAAVARVGGITLGSPGRSIERSEPTFPR